MLFAIVLGTIIGAAGITLLRQWAADVFAVDRSPVITPAAFPRLAPPTRVPRMSAGYRHGLQLRRVA